MVVNATTLFWEDLPPTSAPAGQLITVTGRITNTGNQTEDFRLSVQIVGIGAGIFPVPLEVWSAPTELSPSELYTARAGFQMPSYGVQLTVQAEWYNRAAAPAQWVKVGSTQSRNIALAGVTPTFPTPTPTIPGIGPISLQVPTSTLLLILAGAALIFILMKGGR